eukprot:CAMPEP_0179194074 /NCGR_PEP_ID=MMETSP0796-20121207/96455_1 /TAXON_ID=73915 /ORGANISM="Pyrodinium bahamense, Strain pbaha01" /LENGTH=55 /DNA_ID=CAMNT_0020898399 /DNA_START=255 /DNA_END=419 /DNA_ORIENTATION=+
MNRQDEIPHARYVEAQEPEPKYTRPDQGLARVLSTGDGAENLQEDPQALRVDRGC